MCLEKFVRPLLVGAHQTRIACHIGGEDRGETAFDGLLHSFLQQRRTLAEPQSLMPRKQRRPSSFRGQRPERAATCGKSTPAADKCAAVQPLGPAPRPRYSRAMCGGCVSWLTPCEKKSRRHSPSWAKGRPAARLHRAPHNAPPTGSENASDRVSAACVCRGAADRATPSGQSSREQTGRCSSVDHMREAAQRVELIVLYASAGLRAEPEANVILDPSRALFTPGSLARCSPRW